MVSINAQEATKEVISKVRRGERVNFQEIQKKHGYAETSAKSMKLKETETYKKLMKPIVTQLE